MSQTDQFTKFRKTLMILGALSVLVAATTDAGKEPISKRYMYKISLLRAAAFVAGVAAFFGGAFGGEDRGR